jgi:hypothetical protein
VGDGEGAFQVVLDAQHGCLTLPNPTAHVEDAPRLPVGRAAGKYAPGSGFSSTVSVRTVVTRVAFPNPFGPMSPTISPSAPAQSIPAERLDAQGLAEDVTCINSAMTRRRSRAGCDEPMAQAYNFSAGAAKDTRGATGVTWRAAPSARRGSPTDTIVPARGTSQPSPQGHLRRSHRALGGYRRALGG